MGQAQTQSQGVDWDAKVNVRMLPSIVQMRLINRRTPLDGPTWERMTAQSREEYIDKIDKIGLSVRDVLDESLTWEGIIGFTHMVVSTLDACLIQARK